MMEQRPCLRRNPAMASVVQTAQAMQRLAGRSAAYAYLARHAVPADVMVRALSSSGQKRASATASSADPAAPA